MGIVKLCKTSKVRISHRVICQAGHSEVNPSCWTLCWGCSNLAIWGIVQSSWTSSFVFKGCTVQHGALLFGSYVSVLLKPWGDQISPKPRTKKGIWGWQLVWGGLVEISLWREIKGESKVLDALWVNCIWHPSLPRVLLLWGCTL